MKSLINSIGEDDVKKLIGKKKKKKKKKKKEEDSDSGEEEEVERSISKEKVNKDVYLI